jgi:thiamine biosynthesis lipoprotein
MISHKSKGAFDITTGPINELWDFHKIIVPAESNIKERLRLIDYKNIEIDKDNSTIFLKKKGMKIDLGGIAKGYAAAKLEKIVADAGIKSGIIAVGGDIRAFGMRSNNMLWKVGIKKPQTPRQYKRNNGCRKPYRQICINIWRLRTILYIGQQALPPSSRSKNRIPC